jgi:hypothetical protein
MKPTCKFATIHYQSRLLLALFLTATALMIAGCGGAQVTPTAQIVTVPVEVTRVVEMVNTVEVTRVIPATVIVEVQVTPEVTSTVQTQPTKSAVTSPYLPSSTPVAYAFETPKAAGVSRLKINNDTDEKLKVTINGPMYYAFELPKGKSAFLNVPYGAYTLLVSRENGNQYTAKVSCVSPLKYEVNLRLSDAKIITP